MLRLLKSRFFLRTSLIGLLVAPVLVATLVPGYRPADFVARHLGEQLDSVPDSLMTRHMQQIGKLDESGTPVLVKAIGHPRSIVSESAATALHQQLDQWTRLPSHNSSPRVARVAQLLATHVDQWKPPNRSIAADVALRVLDWPSDVSVIDRPELIADCAHVLQTVPSTRPVQLAVAESEVESSGQAVAAIHAVSTTDGPGGILELPLAGVPGGDLPIDEVQVPPLPPSLANPPSPRPIQGGEPNLVPPTARQLPRIMFPDARAEEEPSSVLPSSPVPRQLPPGTRVRHSLSDIEPTSASTPDEQLDQLSDLDLIRTLSSSPAAQATAAERELRQRGFADPEIDIARRVSDPDPRVRQQLVESLPNLRTSPGPWLFWLSYDPDPLIRRLVVSHMATSQDPRLHHRLREMQALETDPAVSEQLDRLSGERR